MSNIVIIKNPILHGFRKCPDIFQKYSFQNLTRRSNGFYNLYYFLHNLKESTRQAQNQKRRRTNQPYNYPSIEIKVLKHRISRKFEMIFSVKNARVTRIIEIKS